MPAGPASVQTRVTKIVVAALVLAVVGVASASLIFTHAYTGPAEFDFSGYVLNGTVSVDANSYNRTRFIVPASALGTVLQGNFSVQGEGHEVLVEIMSSTAYTSWKDGHRIADDILYTSGRVSSGSITVRLPNQGGATYYIVFDNNSPFSSRETVAVHLSISYRVEIAI